MEDSDPVAAAGRRVYKLSFVSGLLLVLAGLLGGHWHWRVRGLCTFKSLVAGRSNASEPRVVAGVHGCKFTVVPVPVATTILASDHVTCGDPIVQHSVRIHTVLAHE